MPDTQYDVLNIGNAIVDIMAHAEGDFLVDQGLVKGSMRLIHLKCLKGWLTLKRGRLQHQKSLHYQFRCTECELCS